VKGPRGGGTFRRKEHSKAVPGGQRQCIEGRIRGRNTEGTTGLWANRILGVLEKRLYKNIGKEEDEKPHQAMGTILQKGERVQWSGINA